MRIWRIDVLALALTALVSGQALADNDPCAGFKWDVSKERALFASSATPTPAGKVGAAAPVVAPDRLYRITLLPTNQVAFPVTPGKSGSPVGTYGGVLSLSLPAAGKYRIAIDQALWVDIVADGKLLAPSDYEGLHDCNAPRKIVVFTLDVKQQLKLQLSDAPQSTVVLSVTQAPAG
jgi:hypothetical protein